MVKVNKDMIYKVLIEHEKKKNNLQIAKELGISRQTVSRYVNILKEIEEEQEVKITKQRRKKIEKNATKIAIILSLEARGKLGEKLEDKECTKK